MTVARHQAAIDLDRAQQRLSRLLPAEVRDLQQFADAAESTVG